MLCGSPLVLLDVGGRACAFSLARCFDEESKGVDGAAGLLLALSRCQLLQDVRSFLGLVGASWGFLPLFEVEPRGAEYDDSHMLSSVVSSPLRVPARVEPRLQKGERAEEPWPQPGTFRHPMRAQTPPQSRAPETRPLGQELGMRECYKVPAAAWQLLATARWEQLRKADFYQRLGGRLFKRGGILS